MSRAAMVARAVTGEMGKTQVRHQVMPTVNHWDEVVKRCCLETDTLLADVASAPITLVKELKVNRLRRPATQEDTSPVTMPPVVLGVLARVTCKPVALAGIGIRAVGRGIGVLVGTAVFSVRRLPFPRISTGLFAISLTPRLAAFAVQFGIISTPTADVSSIALPRFLQLFRRHGGPTPFIRGPFLGLRFLRIFIGHKQTAYTNVEGSHHHNAGASGYSHCTKKPAWAGIETPAQAKT